MKRAKPPKAIKAPKAMKGKFGKMSAGPKVKDLTMPEKRKGKK